MLETDVLEISDRVQRPDNSDARRSQVNVTDHLND